MKFENPLNGLGGKRFSMALCNTRLFGEKLGCALFGSSATLGLLEKKFFMNKVGEFSMHMQESN